MPQVIVKQENRSGHVTFQNRVYMAGILFDINSQWPFDMVAWLEVGCGCGGQKKTHVRHYRVCAKGNALFIDEKHLVETNVPIPVESQNFDNARRNQHLYPGTDFSRIVAHPDPARIWNQANSQAIDTFRHG